jgi:hypothetical protein
MEQLKQEKIRLANNLDQLYTINQDLDARLKNLTANPDTISVFAHELGYVSDGEKLIKLAGFSGGIDRHMVEGNALVPRKTSFVPEWMCKSSGLAVTAITYILILLFSSEKKNDYSKRRRTFSRNSRQTTW